MIQSSDPYAQAAAQYQRMSQQANPYTDQPRPPSAAGQAVQNVFSPPQAPPQAPSPQVSYRPSSPPQAPSFSGSVMGPHGPYANGQIAPSYGGGSSLEHMPMAHPPEGGMFGGMQQAPQRFMQQHPMPQQPPMQVDHQAPGMLPAPSQGQGHGPSQPPPGWDYAKWNDPNKHDPKYDIGHIIAGAHTSADLAALLPQIQAMYPGTTFDGKDDLMNPLWGHADVLQGASTGHGTPQWLIPGAGAPQGGAPAMGGGNLMGMLAGQLGGGAAQGGSDYSSQILQYLMQQLAINKTLGGGQ